jgi:hypothetical protein
MFVGMVFMFLAVVVLTAAADSVVEWLGGLMVEQMYSLLGQVLG